MCVAACVSKVCGYPFLFFTIGVENQVLRRVFLGCGGFKPKILNCIIICGVE